MGTATRIPVSRAFRNLGDNPFPPRLLAAEGGPFPVPSELPEELGAREGQQVPGPAGSKGLHAGGGAQGRFLLVSLRKLNKAHSSLHYTQKKSEC